MCQRRRSREQGKEQDRGGGRAGRRPTDNCRRLCVGQRAALIERGYTARGGEYLLLLIPFIYYTGKRIAEDWIVELRELWRGRQ